MFRVRLGVAVRNSVSNHVQTSPTSPLGEVYAPFETQVSIDSGIAHLTSLESAVQVAKLASPTLPITVQQSRVSTR